MGSVVRTIGLEAHGVIDAAARAAQRDGAQRDGAQAELPGNLGPGLPIAAERDGWLTQIPTAYILAAVPARTVVQLETRSGGYIHRGEPLFHIWPAEHSEKQRRDMTRKLQRAVNISDTRTMQQDVDFATRQLVDIALRALSAAINDPTTAIEVVLQLGSLLRRLLVTEPAATAVSGKDGKLLLRPWLLSPQDHINHAFDQIRHESTRQLHVATTFARVLRMLIEHVDNIGHPKYAPALQTQLQLLVDAMDAEPGIHPHDLNRFRAVAQASTDPAEHNSQQTQQRSAPPVTLA